MTIRNLPRPRTQVSEERRESEKVATEMVRRASMERGRGASSWEMMSVGSENVNRENRGILFTNIQLNIKKIEVKNLFF